MNESVLCLPRSSRGQDSGSFIFLSSEAGTCISRNIKTPELLSLPYLCFLLSLVVTDSRAEGKLSQSREKAPTGTGTTGRVQAGKRGLSLQGAWGTDQRQGTQGPRPEPQRVSSAPLHNHPQPETCIKCSCDKSLLRTSCRSAVAIKAVLAAEPERNPTGSATCKQVPWSK